MNSNRLGWEREKNKNEKTHTAVLKRSESTENPNKPCRVHSPSMAVCPKTGKLTLMASMPSAIRDRPGKNTNNCYETPNVSSTREFPDPALGLFTIASGRRVWPIVRCATVITDKRSSLERKLVRSSTITYRVSSF